MTYLILGSSGAAGCFAAFLSQGEDEVILSTQEPHQSAIQSHDLILETQHGSFAIPVYTQAESQLSVSPDVIFLCDTDPQCFSLIQKVAVPSTLLFILHSQPQVEKQLYGSLPTPWVTEGILSCKAHWKTPGTVWMEGDTLSIHLDTPLSSAYSAIQQTLEECGISLFSASPIDKEVFHD